MQDRLYKHEYLDVFPKDPLIHKGDESNKHLETHIEVHVNYISMYV